MKFLGFIRSRLSYFDIGIIMSLIILGLGFFFFFYRKPEYVDIRVKVTDQDVLYASTLPQTWYANRFEIGDSERDALGREIANITGIEKFNVDSDRKAVYLDIKVRATYDTRTKLYSARGKTLIFGAPVRFNFSKVTFDGIVTEFPGSDFQKNLKVGTSLVTALSRGVEPFLTEAIQKGDKIFDSNGVLLAEVNNIVVRPAERVTQTSSGSLLLRSDPLYKDIILTATIRTKTIYGETFIFDNLPLRIAEIVPLNFNQVSIFPTILEIIPEE